MLDKIDIEAQETETQRKQILNTRNKLATRNGSRKRTAKKLSLN
jgi:hypothetical protein